MQAVHAMVERETRGEEIACPKRVGIALITGILSTAYSRGQSKHDNLVDLYGISATALKPLD